MVPFRSLADSSRALQRIRHVADNDLVFLCGTSASEVENAHAYDTLICLDIDEATLRDRLSARDGDNDFGNAEHEMQQILPWRKGAATYYETPGGHIVDATMPVHQVVDEIVRIAAATSWRLLAWCDRPTEHDCGARPLSCIPRR